MAGMDANLSIKEAKAQQERICAGGNDQGSKKGSSPKNTEHMKKVCPMCGNSPCTC